MALGCNIKLYIPNKQELQVTITIANKWWRARHQQKKKREEKRQHWTNPNVKRVALTTPPLSKASFCLSSQLECGFGGITNQNDKHHEFSLLCSSIEYILISLRQRVPTKVEHTNFRIGVTGIKLEKAMNVCMCSVCSQYRWQCSPKPKWRESY